LSRLCTEPYITFIFIIYFREVFFNRILDWSTVLGPDRA